MTAFLIAALRAEEGAREHPLFRDRYSEMFVDDGIRATVAQVTSILPEGADMVRLRTCIFNAVVERFLAGGGEQVVSVGAGFDMRSAIFGRDGVVFFDVDQPAVLDFKAEVLAERDIRPAVGVRCDYLKVDLVEALKEAGLDASKTTLFLWEGNTMYLSGTAIAGFLKRLAGRVEGLSIAFDHMSARASKGEGEIGQVVKKITGVLKVEMQCGFDDPSELDDAIPLRVVETGNMLDGARRYADGVSDAHIDELRDRMRFATEYRYTILG